MTVGTVSGATVPVDGGMGDNLPAADSAITVAIVKTLDVVVDGSNVKAVVLSGDASGQICILDDSSAEIIQKHLPAGVVWVWHAEEGALNPLVGENVATVRMSHSGSVVADMRVGIVYNNS